MSKEIDFRGAIAGLDKAMELTELLGEAAVRNVWHPIETAPKDGTAIWLMVGDFPYLGYFEPPGPYRGAKGYWTIKATFRRVEEGTDDIYGTHATDVEPSHWVPLPEPPEDGAAVLKWERKR